MQWILFKMSAQQPLHCLEYVLINLLFGLKLLLCFQIGTIKWWHNVQRESYLKKTLKKDVKSEVANDMHVVQSLRKHLKQSWEAGWVNGGRGSCVFLVEDRSFRALMPVDTPAALAPLCGTLWRVFVGTASHTSWWEPSGHLIHQRKCDKDVITLYQTFNRHITHSKELLETKNIYNTARKS